MHSGTLDVASAAAMAAALRVSRASALASGEPGVTLPQALRDELRAAIVRVAPNERIVTPASDALPGIVTAIFDGCRSDAILMLLDAAGVECSAGSACTAGIPEPSEVLLAMGATVAQARSAVRFSLGWTSTRADVAAVAAALPGALERAGRSSARLRDRVGAS